MHKFWILENDLKSECLVPSSTEASEETDRLKPAFRLWQLVKAAPGHTPDPQATVLLFSV